MITGSYEFLAQDRVIFGKPAAKAVAETMARLNARRALIVSSRSLSSKTGEIDAIRAELGESCIGVYDRCVEHVPRESVLDLMAVVRAQSPDLIVTVGGGTPIDTVKVCLAMLGSGGETVSDFDRFRIQVNERGERVVPPVGDPPLRQIIVPTTLSGAEFSSLGGATDRVRQVKDLYWGRFIGGQVVILDPQIARHTPDWLWISTGVRAIDHAVETICSRAPQPFTDATCIHALGMLASALTAIKRDPSDLEARLNCQLAVWLATTGLGRVDWGASHGIGHQLGAVAGVPHGYCSCVMLPAVMAYNELVNADRQRLVSRALGNENERASVLLRTLISDLGMPGTLAAVNVTRDHVPAITAGAMQNMMVRSNPRPITSQDQVAEILELAF